MAGEKQLVYVLEYGGINAVYPDIDNLCDGLKMEVENMPDEDILESKFIISAKLMTEKELNNLPEFDGF